MEPINAILAKGPGLTAIDVRNLEAEIALLPIDVQHAQAPWIWEAVALIVNDPDYIGDAKLPDSD